MEKQNKMFQSKGCEGILIAVNTTEDNAYDPIAAVTSMAPFDINFRHRYLR